MTTRYFENLSDSLETPFWVHPKDWYDWMLNVDQVSFQMIFNDGFGGSTSADNIEQLVVGDPDDTVYNRDFRWLPMQGDQKYLNEFEKLRASFLSFTPQAMEAWPFPPTNYETENKDEVNGSYGNYGVSSWTDWPLFDEDKFSYTIPQCGMRAANRIINPKVMWRKVWEDEDKEEKLPNPGFRYQIPIDCSAGVYMGSCAYPPTVITNFDPTLGPVPYLAVYDDVFEGANVLIGGPAYADEIGDPLEHDGEPSSGWEEMNVDFKLVALSGREYTVRPRVKSDLSSAVSFTDPSPLWNERQLPFDSTGSTPYGGYECSGTATITLEKT